MRGARTGPFAGTIAREEHEPACARFAYKSLVFDPGLVPCKGEHHQARKSRRLRLTDQEYFHGRKHSFRQARRDSRD
jgi:hypothetical protein